MTTTQDLIAQLRALGIPDWAMARVLMTQAADTLEALQAELDEWRFTNKIDELQRVNEGLCAEVARLKKLSVTNIMLAIVPGDGSGFEVYAKSVAEVEQKLSDMGGELEDWQLGIKRHHMLQEIIDKRNAALARLAELEKQEPAYLLTPDGKCYAYGSAQPLSAGHADATLLKLYAAAGASLVATPIVAWAKSTPRKLRITTMDMGREDGWRPLGYMAAGASPVEPNFCESCAMGLSTCDCVTPRPVFVNQLPSAQPSQALELSDAEIKKISSDLSLYEDYQPESCQADYLDPVKFARAIIAAINAKEQPNG